MFNIIQKLEFEDFKEKARSEKIKALQTLKDRLVKVYFNYFYL